MSDGSLICFEVLEKCNIFTPFIYILFPPSLREGELHLISVTIWNFLVR